MVCRYGQTKSDGFDKFLLPIQPRQHTYRVVDDTLGHWRNNSTKRTGTRNQVTNAGWRWTMLALENKAVECLKLAGA